MGGAGEWAGGFRFFHGTLTLGRLDGWTSDQRWTENAGSGRGYPPKISRSRSRCARPTPRSRHADCLGFRHGEMIRSHSGYLLLLALLQRYVVDFMSAKSEPAVNRMRGVCILYFRYMRSLIIVRVVVAAVMYFSPAARLSGRVKSWLSALVGSVQLVVGGVVLGRRRGGILDLIAIFR